MAIVLGRFSGQNALWEWQMRGIERTSQWTERKLVDSLYNVQERHEILEDAVNEPTTFLPNWAVRQHRQWWAHRETSFPWFFGSVYALFLLWSLAQMVRSFFGLAA
jgi:hypothetical protein